MDNVKIEPMKLNDLEKIKDILTSEFDDFWNYNIIQDEIQNENSKYLVAKLNDEIIGFAGLKIIVDEADIMNIVVKKIYRNKGIGSLVLEDLISLCEKLNLKSVSLEVNESNFLAIHLYEKFDFKIIGNRKKYYKDSDAILMLKELH